MSPRSMTRLDFGDWRIEAYETGWTLGQPRRRSENSKRPGEEYLARQTYYPKLSQALRALQERHLRECGATTAEELLDEIASFRSLLDERFTL